MRICDECATDSKIESPWFDVEGKELCKKHAELYVQNLVSTFFKHVSRTQDGPQDPAVFDLEISVRMI
jgi:hypothetical protein